VGVFDSGGSAYDSEIGATSNQMATDLIAPGAYLPRTCVQKIRNGDGAGQASKRRPSG